MKEKNFEVSKQDVTNPNYNQTQGYIDSNKVNHYLFCSHAYEGSGGFKDGGYLIPFERELFYQKRKTFSAYRNFVKPIVNAMVDPVFSAKIVRNTTNDMFQAFIYDADNRGTDLHYFVKEVAILARLHGVVFVIMDNFSEIPNTREEAINQRKLPYVYIQKAYNVDTFVEDDFGKLISITFKCKSVKVDNKELSVKVTYTQDMIIKSYFDGDKIVSQKPTYHGLGKLPVITVYSSMSSDVLPVPPMYDICKLNLCLYNKDSELRDNERAQAFSIFYAQLGNTGGNNNIALGPHAMVNLPADPSITIAPGYASPDSSVLSYLTKSAEDFIDNIFRSAEQNGITGLRSSSSGIEAGYKFLSSNNQLKTTSEFCQDFELKLADMFAHYTNENVEYTVSFPKDFNLFYNQMGVDEALKLMSVDLPNEVKLEIKKMIVSRYLNHLDNDTMGRLYEFIEKN
jgi:hypothetical protein